MAVVAQAASPARLRNISLHNSNTKNVARRPSPAVLRALMVALGHHLGVRSSSPVDLSSWYSVTSARIRIALSKSPALSASYTRATHSLRQRQSPLRLLRPSQDGSDSAIESAIESEAERPHWQLLALSFPEHTWDLALFPEAVVLDRALLTRHRYAVTALGLKLGVVEGDYAAWYHVDNKRVHVHGGTALLAHFGNSLSAMLSAVYSEHTWDVARFAKRPQNYWRSREQQRAFLSSVALKCGVHVDDLSSWYGLRLEDVVSHGGASLGVRYSNSLFRMLSSAFPEHVWDAAQFRRRPHGFWSKNLSAQREHLDQLRLKLGLTLGDHEAWYRVSRADLIKQGGGSLLKLYGDSPRALLTTLVPEHTWHTWRFQGQRRQDATLRRAAKAAEDALGLKTRQDWYNVHVHHLARLAAGAYARNSEELLVFLRRVYPEHTWDRGALRTENT